MDFVSTERKFAKKQTCPDALKVFLELQFQAKMLQDKCKLFLMFTPR